MQKVTMHSRNGTQADLFYGQDSRSTLDGLGKTRVNCVITSPPYWLQRQYGTEPQSWKDGWAGELGLEPDPDQFARHVAEVFRSVKRVLRTDGVVWLNIGDTYMSNETGDPSKITTGIQGQRISKNKSYEESTATHKRPTPTDVGLRFKSLAGIPWRVAFALQADGWIIRNEMIWHRPDSMPSRASDRLLVGHETIFLLSRSRTYQFDRYAAALAGFPTELSRDVWTFNCGRSRGKHHAVMPVNLAEAMVLMGCPKGGTILDPFAGTAAVGEAAMKQHRNFIGIDLNESYLKEARKRLESL